MSEIINNYPRGSEWRRWDLHVHTTDSDNNPLDENDLINQINYADCDVIGICDYFSINGYINLRDKIKNKVLFPVVELRMNNALFDKDTLGNTDINFHIIFNPKIDCSVIDIFIKSLNCSTSNGFDEKIGIILANNKNPNNYTVSFNYVLSELKGNDSLKDNFLIWLPYDEYGGIDNIDPHLIFKSYLLQKTDIIGSSREKQIQFFHWKDPNFNSDDYKKMIIKQFPCIKGSDSHRTTYPIGKLMDKDSNPTNRFCWIKADPTFNGLKQIVNEPADRVFIGEVPPVLERLKTNPTDFIESITIVKKEEASNFPESWFDIKYMPLNPELVAIIGNKGSGKSALAEILAYLGNSKTSKYFSFLNDRKFKHRKKGNKANSFKGSIKWVSGKIDSKDTLNEAIKESDLEIIKCLPQHYIEEQCKDYEDGESKDFINEIKRILFSHIPDEEKNEKDDYDKLIEYLNSAREDSMIDFRNRLHSLNDLIIENENKLSKTYIKRYEENLIKKNEVLDAEKLNQPIMPIVPTESSEEVKKIITELEIEKQTHENFFIEIDNDKKDLSRLNLLITQAGILRENIQNISLQFENWITENQDYLDNLELNLGDIVRITKNTELIDNKEIDIKAKRDKIVSDIKVKNEKASKITIKIKDLQNKLDEPSKKLEQYKKELKEHQERKSRIIGEEDIEGTIKFFQAKLSELDRIPEVLKKQYETRNEIVGNIFNAYRAWLNSLITLNTGVQAFIDAQNIEQLKDFKFSAILKISLFEEKFLENIDATKKGNYHGNDEGRQKIKDLIQDTNFEDKTNTILFANTVINLLNPNKDEYDQDQITSQLKKDRNLNEIYDFVFGLGYLKPEHSLAWKDKPLEQLSPGERGTLLLIFYLLVDKSEIPLIIDQPEENLDNQTVVEILRPCIEKAKKKRQVIIVTHNPNLAVVCDAEQIIHAELDKKNNNKLTYVSGSIENPVINKLIVDVLEGTRPAFDNREAKYSIQGKDK